MKIPIRLVPALWGLLSGASALLAGDLDWPSVQRETKPWTRWWWLGSIGTKADFSSEMPSSCPDMVVQQKRPFLFLMATTVETTICLGRRCSLSSIMVETTASGGSVTTTASDSFTASALSTPLMFPCISDW